MSDISTIYCEIRDRLFPEGDITIPSVQKLKEKIKKNFCAKLVFWCPSHGSELVYNDSVEKGLLVEVAIRAKLSKQNWEDKRPTWQWKTAKTRVTDLSLLLSFNHLNSLHSSGITMILILKA